MMKKLKDTFSLTDQGVKSVLVGILTSTLHNISILVPTILLFVVVSGLISHYRKETPDVPGLFFYWGIALIIAGGI